MNLLGCDRKLIALMLREKSSFFLRELQSLTGDEVIPSILMFWFGKNTVLSSDEDMSYMCELDVCCWSPISGSFFACSISFWALS